MSQPNSILGISNSYSFELHFIIIIVLGSSSLPCCFVLQSYAKILLFPAVTMVDEAPFRAREKLIEKQRLFQSIHKHTHLKGPVDKITSVAIPLALAGSSLFLIGRGIYNMSHGIGKKE
uniref:Uncharacterized protein n=2 Tax=Helianthus annuus TaxID=4232 RepID=A0A251UV20_HELAN